MRLWDIRMYVDLCTLQPSLSCCKKRSELSHNLSLDVSFGTVAKIEHGRGICPEAFGAYYHMGQWKPVVPQNEERRVL